MHLAQPLPLHSGFPIILSVIQRSFDFKFFVLSILVVILIVLLGFISYAEVSFFSIKGKHLKQLKDSPHTADKLIYNLVQTPKSLLATILITNTLLVISTIILINVIINKYFFLGNNPVLSFLIQVVFITTVIVIFGELTPKIHSNQTGIGMAKFLAFPLRFFMKVFYPISSVMVKSTNIIERKVKNYQDKLSLEDIKHAIDITISHQENIEEKKILKRIVNFGNVTVKQIMTPRNDAVLFDSENLFHQVINDAKINRFSRVPVYKDQTDKIIGVLYIKDLIAHFDKEDDFNWTVLLHKPYFVPENKKIDDLLKEFQLKKVHIALVVDEYGGFSGLITMEDILEEIVGEITDEFDDATRMYSQPEPGHYVFKAKTSLSDFLKVLNLSENSFDELKGESETIGGLIIEIIGRIPKSEETIQIGELAFRIISASTKSIGEVEITLNSQEA